MKSVLIAVFGFVCALTPNVLSGIGGGVGLPDNPCGGDGGGGEPVFLNVPTDFSTIQEAIHAATPGSVIRISAGHYYEQLVLIDKILTLHGEPGAVLHGFEALGDTLQPFTAARAMVGILRGHVTVSGLILEGDRFGGQLSSGALNGVFYLGAGGRLEDCTFRGFRGPNIEVNRGSRALVLWNPASTGASEIHVEVFNNRFEDNEYAISIGGDERLHPDQSRTAFTLVGNNILGLGPVAREVNGITINPGASGLIRGNTIADHKASISGLKSNGILAFDGLARSGRTPAEFLPLQPITLEGNTFRDNDQHLIIIKGDNSLITKNIFEDTSPDGPAAAFSGRNVRVCDNDFSNSSVGILLFGNEGFFRNWPPVGSAIDTEVTSNWFANVSTPISVGALAVDVHQSGTQATQGASLEPVFQFIYWERVEHCAPGPGPIVSDSARILLRRWHGQPLIIEASSDLRNWTAVYDSDTSLPVLEYIQTNPPPTLRFYRARNK